MKRYFIIGTDTDCGKTYVTCELVHYFKQQFSKVVAIKPVASGQSDMALLNKANGFTVDDKGFWRFKAPISPHLAAKREAVALTVKDIISRIDAVQIEADLLLIEGAGGLMVPLNDDETWIDLLTLSKIPVLFVVGMRLGCLNHALLTAHALKTHNIQCEGWIANCIDEQMDALDENIATLKAKLPFPLLGTVPYNDRISNSKSSSTMSI